MSYSQQYLDKQKRRREFSAFSNLVATPGNLSTGVMLPAAGDIYASNSVLNASPLHVVSIGTRDISIPPGAANFPRHIGYFGRGVTLEVASGLGGTTKLYVMDAMGRKHEIGTCTV